MSGSKRTSAVTPKERRPSILLMLLRGAGGRCPRCGDRRGWRLRWFGRLERCRGCGYKYARSSGFSLGAITMNMVVTLGLATAVMVVGFFLMYPDIKALPISLASGAAALLVSTLFAPASSTLWAAIDLAMRPLDLVEEAEAVTWLASQGS